MEQAPSQIVLVETKRNPSSSQKSKHKNMPKEPGTFITSERERSTKNIVKNYGKAICTFACSELGTPYLEPLLEENQVKLENFVEFVESAKESIDSLQSFRNLLLVKEEDDSQLRAYKKIFVSLGEVFIKCFSVNWIFSGRVRYKDTHLKFRYKMLRRIQHPELFTYLKRLS